MVDIESQLNAC
ncbi:MAG: hypothetical protein IAF58_17675 [Leptolyngbya sp.]|nr:hypothetical protein [Candidatus Melainabacteria bacterium]